MESELENLSGAFTEEQEEFETEKEDPIDPLEWSRKHGLEEY